MAIFVKMKGGSMPLTDDKRKSIRQAKTDALCARYLHERRLRSLRRSGITVDLFALLVPGLYFVARYLMKGNTAVEIGWEILAAILFALGLLKVVLKWQERAETHSHLRRANISLIREADIFLDEGSTATNPNADWFLKMVATQDEADGDILLGVKETEKQQAYREALKQLHSIPAEANCLNCGANVWKFQPGTCQLCGGTPTNPK
jgi:mobilome CxxCx(11)CxxC protein